MYPFLTHHVTMISLCKRVFSRSPEGMERESTFTWFCGHHELQRNKFRSFRECHVMMRRHWVSVSLVTWLQLPCFGKVVSVPSERWVSFNLLFTFVIVVIVLFRWQFWCFILDLGPIEMESRNNNSEANSRKTVLLVITYVLYSSEDADLDKHRCLGSVFTRRSTQYNECY